MVLGILGEGSSGASASSGTIGNAGSGGISATISTASFPYVNLTFLPDLSLIGAVDVKSLSVSVGPAIAFLILL